MWLIEFPIIHIIIRLLTLRTIYNIIVQAFQYISRLSNGSRSNGENDELWYLIINKSTYPIIGISISVIY